MRLKLRSTIGIRALSIENNQLLLGEFLDLVQENFGITDKSNEITSLKSGFPPKPIAIHDLSISINEAGIKDGEQLIVDFSSRQDTGETSASSSKGTAITTTSKQQQSDIPAVHIDQLQKYLILRNIPDDNSCMFNSISYAVNGSDSFSEGGRSTSKSLRSVVESYIKSNPDKYNQAILERSPNDYCDWITKKDSWGGAIELGILADWFNVRINCIDVASGNILSFESESTAPKKFILLVYSGIHYDVLGLNSKLSKNKSDFSKDETCWEVHSNEAELITTKSLVLCKSLQTKNYTTNTTTFTVRCLECYKVLVGETGATKHANDTGHLRFGEVND